MQHAFRQLSRLFVYSAVFLLAVIALMVGLIQIQNRLFRYRAERILEDVRSIELRHTTFQEADAISQRWSGFARSEMPCSKQHCDIHISLMKLTMFSSSPRLFRILQKSYRLLGGQVAGVRATIDVRNGVVWGESYLLAVAPPLSDTEDEDGRRGEYELVASISTDWANRIAPLAWPSARTHPEYQVTWADACFGCVEIEVHITPFADRADIRRLSEFNFSCLTRFGFCRKRQDILPAAMAEASRERALWNRNEQPSCDLKVIQILSRDLENAAIFELVSNRTVLQTYEDTHRTLEVRLIERLKGTSFWEPGAQGSMDVRDPLALAPIDGLTNVRPGERLIILFWRQPGLAAPVGAEVCGVVPYTEANLAVVRAGAAQDQRISPMIEYYPDFHPGKFSDLPRPPWSVPGAGGRAY